MEGLRDQCNVCVLVGWLNFLRMLVLFLKFKVLTLMKFMAEIGCFKHFWPILKCVQFGHES